MGEHDDFPLRSADNRSIENSRDVIRLLGDAFDNYLYTRVTPGPEVAAPGREYHDNRAFWEDAIGGRVYQGVRVTLRGFHVSEWLPASPGRYFTPDAASVRRRARGYAVRRGEVREYAPLGKLGMILGGVGCLRLRQRTIDGRLSYLVGAAAGGTGHEGVPVILAPGLYDRVIHTIKASGGVACDVGGVVQTVPTDLSLVRYPREVPRLVVAADDITPVRPAGPGEPRITVAVSFPSSRSWSRPVTRGRDPFETDPGKGWAFATFTPVGRTATSTGRSRGSPTTPGGTPPRETARPFRSRSWQTSTNTAPTSTTRSSSRSAPPPAPTRSPACWRTPSGSAGPGWGRGRCGHGCSSRTGGRTARNRPGGSTITSSPISRPGRCSGTWTAFRPGPRSRTPSGLPWWRPT